jgi:riboflavin kinase / FMN adenylyltransferase
LIIHHDINNFIAHRPVVTIGTFDGVHLGHLKVIEQLKQIAHGIHGESVLFTFYPHPRLVLSDENSDLRLLSTIDEKIDRLSKAGIDHLLLYPFTKTFASLTYQQFVLDVLLAKMKLHTLVVGHDHRLGKNREGSYENLVALSKKNGFGVEKIDAFLYNEIDISSSKIRHALQEGDVSKARHFLGYSFSIKGKVAQGNKIGREIEFPTANIEANDPNKLIPARGVYAITIEVDGVLHKAMLNIGYRPTVNINADKRTIEAHIFDFNRDIYQKEVTLYFHQRVRDEIKFLSLDELKAQLLADKNCVLKMLEKT